MAVSGSFDFASFFKVHPWCGTSAPHSSFRLSNIPSCGRDAPLPAVLQGPDTQVVSNVRTL